MRDNTDILIPIDDSEMHSDVLYLHRKCVLNTPGNYVCNGMERDIETPLMFGAVNGANHIFGFQEPDLVDVRGLVNNCSELTQFAYKGMVVVEYGEMSFDFYDNSWATCGQFLFTDN